MFQPKVVYIISVRCWAVVPPGFGARGAKRGVESHRRRRDRDHWRIYGRPIWPWPWPLNFSNIFRENLNGQHDHFNIIFSLSKFNLPLLRTNYIFCYSSVFKPVYTWKNMLYSHYCAMQFAIFSRDFTI